MGSKNCLHPLEVNELSLRFPNFELYGLGSQIRRFSYSSPANIAEGWNGWSRALLARALWYKASHGMEILPGGVETIKEL